jgi:molybdate-binding protein
MDWDYYKIGGEKCSEKDPNLQRAEGYIGNFKLELDRTNNTKFVGYINGCPEISGDTLDIAKKHLVAQAIVLSLVTLDALKEYYLTIQ